MNRTYLAAALALGLAFAAAPAGAVVYCKTVGVPKGCVARPVRRCPAQAPPVWGWRRAWGSALLASAWRQALVWRPQSGPVRPT
jgi:hypothetical protein